MKKISIIAILITVLMLSVPLAAASLVDHSHELNYDPDNFLEPVIPGEVEVDTQLGRYTDDPVDSVLKKVLRDSSPSKQIDIIVQFKGEVRQEDRQMLEELDFLIIREYNVIPAINCIGPKESVEFLAKNPRVFWIEYNEEMELLMHGTTTVINATKVWNSNVLNFNGQDEGRITGKGVTCVVLDTGIDAGHPDLDYHEKTIMNLKSDRGNEPWIEMENSDTGCGHGTHCAGTVGGNGEASGGAKAGVAKDCFLIGLCTGEYMLTGVVGALHWTYEHSKPGNNPHNIRVVSNSWGAGGGEYSPQDSISQISEKITYENNVVVVFAAGNSGGEGDDIQSSNYGNTPANICVAALEHDGGGIASFSSRGQSDLNGTWPDIGAPGVKIWSTAARRTVISFNLKTSNPTDFNPYYFAISGTSMATPHISGIVTLMFQAYQGLKTSNVHDDYNGDIPDFFNMTTTVVHEAELILEAAADYIEPNGDNGVPTDVNATGWTGKPHDYAQGYGMVMVDRAIGITLALKELRTRDFDMDGLPDYPEATVADAVTQYQKTFLKQEVTKETDTLYNEWKGEWCKFNNQSTNVIPYFTDESHFLYIPEEASSLTVSLDYSFIQTQYPQVGTLRLVIDATGDGNPDWSQALDTNEHKEDTINLESGGLSGNKGRTWVFNIEGHGIILPFLNFWKRNQYYEARIEYTASAVITVDQSSQSNFTLEFEDLHAATGQWEFGTPSSTYANGTISKQCYFYDLAAVGPLEVEPEVKEPDRFPIIPFILILLAIAAGIGVAVIVYKKRKK